MCWPPLVLTVGEVMVGLPRLLSWYSAVQNRNGEVSLVIMTLCCSKPKWRGVPHHDDSLLPWKRDTCPQITSPPFFPKMKVQISSIIVYLLIPIVHFPLGAEKSRSGQKQASLPCNSISRTWVLRGDFDYLPEPQIQKWLHHWKAYDL